MNPVRVPLFVPLVVLPAAAVFAQGVRSAANDASPEVLAPFTVASPRVANQEPAGTFTMPVSALRFEPRVDVQARNFAEGQADVAIRGGIFENTGFRVGALPLYDPQTGHYFAEIPVSAAMLGAPQVLTGADQARGGWNATAGSIAYGWRPVRTGGLVALSAGEYDSHREELYAGYASDHRVAGQRVAADVAVAHSESDGTIAYGDHDFTRYNARLQLAGEGTQTDLFAGYQSKFFGWPNLYTPFNALESENLQTTLVALNHRAAFGADGDYVQAGAYYRRNRDDYDFNRVTEAGKDALFQHTTWVYGASLDGRVSVAPDLAVGYRAGVVTDELKSTSLTFGRFRTRTHVSAGVYPEKRFDLGSGRAVVVTAGAGYDDTNRDGSAVSPLAEVAYERPDAACSRIYASYAKTTQVPTYTALNSSATAGLFRGNPDLGRSASHNLELGARGTWLGWEHEAAVFFRRDDRLVDWTFRRGVTARTANAVDIDSTGVEFFARRTFGRVDLIFGYAWLHKDADYGAAMIDASFYALNFPKHRLTAATVVRLGRGFELRMDNEARLQEDNLLRTTGGDETVISSAGLYWRVPSVRGLQLSLQVDNLWNSNFQEVPAVPAGNRLTTAGVAYAW